MAEQPVNDQGNEQHFNGHKRDITHKIDPYVVSVPENQKMHEVDKS
jgi:hypothetical protein